VTIKVDPKLLAVIRAAMGARNLKRKDFADSYEISQQYFGQMLRGKERWREEVLDQMLTDLNIMEAVKKMGLR